MDVLMTHYNQGSSVKESIRSLDQQLSSRSQIYVVDAGSTTSTFRKLETLYAQESISLEHEPDVSRGHGRQLALDKSEQEIVAAHLDLDTVFEPILPEIVEFYRDLIDERGTGLLVFHGGMVGTRSHFEEIGGWNDLQVHEDKDVWIRSSEATAVYVLPVSIVYRHYNVEWQSRRYRLRRTYYNYRDSMRLGLSKESLLTSMRTQWSRPHRLWERPLFEYAHYSAQRLETYNTIAGLEPASVDYPLRELTFDMLVESGNLDVSYIEPPQSLESFVTDQNYPGQTSYSDRLNSSYRP